MQFCDKKQKNGTLLIIRKRKSISDGSIVAKRQKRDKDIATFGQKEITNGSTQCNKTTTALLAQAQNRCGAVREKEGQFMLEALNGFLIFVNRKGSIKFVTNTIQDHLGLKQEYLFGKNIYDYIHENDHKELAKQFTEDKRADNQNISPFEEEPQRVFYLRMKFNLQKPGSKAKHTGFMLVQWSGKMKRHLSMKLGTVVTDGLLCICRPMQTTPMLEIRMDGNMFMSRHDLGMTFTFCDTRIITLLGYEPNEVIGKTAYHFHNPIDAPKVGDCHHNLIIKGTSVSKYYRFLGKADNWVWLQTRATIIYNTANKAQYIVCMNYVISEEEGEKYLMLEEHQHANRHTENTVLMLPDNQHHPQDTCIITQCPNSGPKIVELEEENLEKTACFNGELDGPPTTESCIPSATSQQMTDSSVTSAPQWNSMATMTGFQQNDNGTAPAHDPPITNISSIPLVGVGDGQSDIPVDIQISQPVMAEVPEVNMTQSDSPMEDNNSNTVSDPQVPESVQACSQEGSTGAYPSPLGLQHSNEHYINGMVDQNMGASCSSSHSDDAGYESASSPYNGSYFSPQMVSPVCSYDSGSDRGGYTPDINNRNGLIQGQNCSLGVGYGQAVTLNQNSNMLQGEHPMDVLADSNTEFSNPVLDEILQSLNQTTSDNLDVNMALVYSSIESLTSKTPSSVATSAMSPGGNAIQQTKPMATTKNSMLSFQQKKQLEKRTDKPLLRSFLTMPKESIPSQPPGGFIQMHNKKEEKLSLFVKVNDPVSKQASTSAQTQNNPNLTCRNNINRGSGEESLQENANGQIENNDHEALDFDEIPEYALQYLVNDFTDAQAQALIADLQGEGGLQNDSFMDTSESDFTKEFVSSLENQSMLASSSSANGDYNSFAGPQVGSNIPFSQCKTQCNSLGTSTKCNSSQQYNLNSRLSESNISAGNYSGVSSGHDHLYHQSANRLNGQNRQRFHKLPENRGASIKLSNGQNTCHSQTQTSEHCMSELERHLRNKKLTSREMSFNGVQSACIMNSEKPFLQQLLTGELTNDMYMRMERSRFYNKGVVKK